MKVYLDDERKTPDGWTRTYSVKDTIELLKTYQVKELSLDHDLGDDQKLGTGYDCILWIEEKVFNDPNYIPPIMTIHSANPAGRKNMELGINSIKRIIENRK
jgi:hypothetical protein